MRGRPKKSRIRERITAIVNKRGITYGYEIYKLYKEVYGDITSRIIYYNLKKGVELGELNIINIKRELGAYSWGDESERVYYAIGPYATISQEDLTLASKIKHNERKINYKWDKEIQKYYKELKEKARQAKGTEVIKIMNKCDKLIQWCRTRLDNGEEYIRKIESIKNFLH